MMHGRHTDRRGIERPHRSQTRLDCLEGWRLESGNAERLRGFGRNSIVAVDYSGKLDRLAGLLQLTIDAKVIAPERSRSNDGDAQWVRGRHYFFSVRVSSGASTTWRQRA